MSEELIGGPERAETIAQGIWSIHDREVEAASVAFQGAPEEAIEITKLRDLYFTAGSAMAASLHTIVRGLL